MPEIQIRPAVAADFPRLMGFDHSCSSDYVWQLDLQKGGGQTMATFREVRLPRSIQVPYPRDVFALADAWERQPGILLAVLRNQPVGYLHVLEQRTSALAWVVDLAVSVEMRRHGVASALILAAQDWALERGHQRIILEMSSKNYPAVRLAQKLGYEFCGYNDHYYATQDIALFFGRALK